MFSEIYNFIVIEKKRRLVLKTDIYVDTFYNEYSDEEYYDKSDNSNEESSDEKIQLKKIKYINLFLGKIRKI